VEVRGERPLPERGVEQPPPATRAAASRGEGEGGGFGGGPPGGGRGMFPPIDWDDPEQVKQVRERMRERGMSEEQIDERIQKIRQRMGGG
jgi:microsomal dipeptidase-like Zn-dependent dipeptidase